MKLRQWIVTYWLQRPLAPLQRAFSVPDTDYRQTTVKAVSQHQARRIAARIVYGEIVSVREQR